MPFDSNLQCLPMNSYTLGEVVNVKVIKDKVTGGSAGYCFIDFPSAAAASKLLATYNGTTVPGSSKVFKLNWATHSAPGQTAFPMPDRQSDLSIFVGDLAPEVNDYALLTLFQTRYASVKSARVVMDASTSMSKGYGFVKFGDEEEQQRAMTEMQGQFCGSRQIRISSATPKHRMAIVPTGGMFGMHRQQHQQFNHSSPAYQAHYANDPNNTTCFVGGLPPGMTEGELRTYFVPFGEVIHIKVPVGKSVAFVQYAHKASAELAIQQMSGFTFDSGARLRLSWGRPQAQASHYGAMAPSYHHSAQYTPASAGSPHAIYPGAGYISPLMMRQSYMGVQQSHMQQHTVPNPSIGLNQMADIDALSAAALQQQVSPITPPEASSSTQDQSSTALPQANGATNGGNDPLVQGSTDQIYNCRKEDAAEKLEPTLIHPTAPYTWSMVAAAGAASAAE